MVHSCERTSADRLRRAVHRCEGDQDDRMTAELRRVGFGWTPCACERAVESAARPAAPQNPSRPIHSRASCEGKVIGFLLRRKDPH
jgi:hypothetical protein